MFGSLLNPQNQRPMTALISIVFGCLGVHKFMLGYNKEGTILLVITIFSVIPYCFFLIVITGLIGVLEGLNYLRLTDKQFADTYIEGRKSWF